MAFFDRLFGRRAASVEPDARQSVASGADTAPDPPVPVSPPPPVVGPAEGEPAFVAGPLLSQQQTQPGEAPALKALYGYQQDPAFKNFQERLKRPPGLERRARKPSLDYPPPATLPGARPPSRSVSSANPAAPAPPLPKPER